MNDIFHFVFDGGKLSWVKALSVGRFADINSSKNYFENIECISKKLSLNQISLAISFLGSLSLSGAAYSQVAQSNGDVDPLFNQSVFTAPAGLYVSKNINSNGEIRIENGGRLNSGTTYVGYGLGSAGVVTVKTVIQLGMVILYMSVSRGEVH